MSTLSVKSVIRRSEEGNLGITIFQKGIPNY